MYTELEACTPKSDALRISSAQNQKHPELVDTKSEASKISSTHNQKHPKSTVFWEFFVVKMFHNLTIV